MEVVKELLDNSAYIEHRDMVRHTPEHKYEDGMLQAFHFIVNLIVAKI